MTQCYVDRNAHRKQGGQRRPSQEQLHQTTAFGVHAFVHSCTGGCVDESNVIGREVFHSLYSRPCLRPEKIGLELGFESNLGQLVDGKQQKANRAVQLRYGTVWKAVGLHSC